MLRNDWFVILWLVAHSPLALRGVRLWNPEFWNKETLMLLHQDCSSQVIWVSPSGMWGAGAPSVFGVLHLSFLQILPLALF